VTGVTTEIKYVEGDATRPRGEGNRIIAHICNDTGTWGAGFVEALSDRFPSVEAEYRDWVEESTYSTLPLGEVQFISPTENLWVANMIGQVGRRTLKSVPPIRYYAVEEALKTVARRASSLDASVHMPRIGTGLAGGSWNRIEPIIRETLLQQGVRTVVYDLPGEEETC